MRISDAGGENALIDRIRRAVGPSTSQALAVGIGDDAALIDSDGFYTIVTTDLLIEGTHFRLDLNDPRLLGWKAAAVNISDIAAMGGEPTYTFVSIGLPDVEVELVDWLYEGISEACGLFGSVIAGGDTTASDHGIVLNITQLGRVEKDRAALRSGARDGDAILVTNTLGDSLAGLELLLRGDQPARENSQADNTKAWLVDRHLRPVPRVREARAAVATGKVTSMMDLSDGLAADLPRLCAASSVGAVVIESELPVSAQLAEAAAGLGRPARELAAAGGEDYELLMTCAPEDAGAVAAAVSNVGSTATVIGRIISGTAVSLESADGSRRPLPPGWAHFGAQ